MRNGKKQQKKNKGGKRRNLLLLLLLLFVYIRCIRLLLVGSSFIAGALECAPEPPRRAHAARGTSLALALSDWREPPIVLLLSTHTESMKIAANAPRCWALLHLFLLRPFLDIILRRLLLLLFLLLLFLLLRTRAKITEKTKNLLASAHLLLLPFFFLPSPSSSCCNK